LAALLIRKGPAKLFFLIAVLCAVVMCGGGLPGYRALFQHLPRAVQNAAYTEFAEAGFSLAMAVAAALTLQHSIPRRGRVAVVLALACSPIEGCMRP